MHSIVRRLLMALAVGSLVVGSIRAATATAAGLPLTLVKDGFTEPVFVTNAGDSRLFVVQQDGLIKVIHADNSVTTFLDVRGVILHDSERGLFSLAFHPNYARNGLFYVDYTRAGDGASTVAEYRVSAHNPDVADPSSGRVVIVVKQPYRYHNGGWIGFKGKDLFVSVGDGGSPGDVLGNAQSRPVLNGKIVRINPRDPDGNGPRKYGIPRGNPFVGIKGKDEIWSWGLRNPWRCSFDNGTGKLWCADVGEGLFEEIDRVTTRQGHNFGWNRLEGFHYFAYPGKTGGDLCTADCKTLPIAEYSHEANAGPCASVVGGYVARRAGAAMHGMYVFGDYCSGKVYEISADWTAGATLPAPVANVGQFKLVSFGQGADGKLYLVDHSGSIFVLDES
jgi:Glucose / Sorbosone dehydrogenase